MLRRLIVKKSENKSLTIGFITKNGQGTKSTIEEIQKLHNEAVCGVNYPWSKVILKSGDMIIVCEESRTERLRGLDLDIIVGEKQEWAGEVKYWTKEMLERYIDRMFVDRNSFKLATERLLNEESRQFEEMFGETCKRVKEKNDIHIKEDVPVNCPICGKGTYVSKDDYACADVNCKLGHGAKAYYALELQQFEEQHPNYPPLRKTPPMAYKQVEVPPSPSLVESLKELWKSYEEDHGKGYDKLLKALDHQYDIQPSDAIGYAAINIDYLQKQAEAEAIKKAMKHEPTYNLQLTQQEITILWGLLNDNKGNLCYSQMLAKVEKLRPSGGFYDKRRV